MLGLFWSPPQSAPGSGGDLLAVAMIMHLDTAQRDGLVRQLLPARLPLVVCALAFA